MKKTVTLWTAMMMAATLCAQNLVFVDKAGNTLADGTVVTVSETEVNDFDETQIPLTSLAVKNNSGAAVQASIDWNVNSVPSGRFACCLGGVCMSTTTSKTLQTADVALQAGETMTINQTEWVPADGQYGTCEVEAVLYEDTPANGTRVTLRFVYGNAQSYCYGYPATGITLQDTLVAGNIKTATISGFSNAKHTGAHYALLSMPATVSNTLSGCKITQVAFYPFLTSMTSAKIVISREIGGEPLYEQNVEGIKSQTWSEVKLNTPFSIPSDEQLYIGYEIESATGDYPVGYYYTSNPSASATVDPVIDWIAYDNSGTIKSGMLDAQMYAARRQTANLMLYATIEGTTLPANAVAVGTTKLSGGRYIRPNETQTLTCYYTNTGLGELQSFDVTVTDGTKVLAQQTFTPASPLAPMWEGSFSVNIPSDQVGLHKLNVSIDRPNGQTNCYTGTKTTARNFLVYADSVKRNVLLEHFTTGQCVNCVKGETLVEEELALVDADIQVVRINHHSGYGTDKLTIADDEAYEWFYGETYIWAPANMIDRTDLAAYGAKGYGGTATLGPVFGTANSKSISTLVTSAAHLPSFITIDVTARVDAARQLTVNVQADQLYEMPQAELMRLNVAIVQDSVKAAQTLADGTVDKNFIHNNVLRANLTGTWGETAEFAGNKLNRSFTYTLPATWNERQLRVVAFLSDYDASNTKNCCLYNVAEAQVVTSATGLEVVRCADSASDGYNLFGQRAAAGTKGLVIVGGKKYVKQ